MRRKIGVLNNLYVYSYVVFTLFYLLAALLGALLFHDKKLFSFIASNFTGLNSG